ncbi:hypothetical protein GCM10027443_05110 [Pontibacter brevis]
MALCTLTLSSCKDDEEDVSPNVGFLTSGEWKGDAIYVSNTPIRTLIELLAPNDIKEELKAQTDISGWRFNFERNGNFTASGSGTAGSGKWRFEDNEQVLVLTDEDNAEQRFRIKKISATELNLEANVEDFGFSPDDVFDIQTFEIRLKR